ncbi:MAG: helix-turn-helix transcriptional regulator [Clostridia bacterium]|nr:helix-turn-helix transcriptional regulator [Clostridia bacterium]
MDKYNIDIKQVGQRIRAARTTKKMSQADLSFEADISLPHISDIENGKKMMQLDTFVKIIEVLKVSSDSILRPDVPEVNQLYQKEFYAILSDCTPTEIDSILKIVREVKDTIHKNED